MAAANEQYVRVGDHRIRLTNLDKVLYPATGTTKAQVLDYYARVADALIPLAADRPVTRKRWVNGVGTDAHPGQVFFQKNLDAGAPDWVPRRSIEHSDHENVYPLLTEPATLIWMAQVAALELHVPQWRFGRTGERMHPDRLVLDLDPGEGTGLAECVVVAKAARTILQGMGLQPLPVTSGSKGIHLCAALDGSQSSTQVSEVAHELARVLEADLPDLVVSDMKKSLRVGRVLVDWSQNNGNKTTIVPYSLRGRSEPTVAAPRTWDELDDPELAQLDLAAVIARVESGLDPLAPLRSAHVAQLEPTPAHLDALQPTPASADRLAEYRAKRDGARTPEPVPDAPGADAHATDAPLGSGRSFVIQEHHARRLHWDFRLEHDGVLVSWALPKGVPTDTGQNHLAVQTEDHPLEYGTFEGRIPSGEYGGGDVTIWDSGVFDLHKWRDGAEVIVTLHGRRGDATYALIHTRGRGGARDEQNWLIHLMDHVPDYGEQPAAREGADGVASVAGRPSEPAPPAGSDAALPKPMLATSATERDVDARTDWVFEMKWDGIRALARVADRTVTLTSRAGNDLTAAYPELAALADAVPHDAVLDGEIVALGPGGAPDFGLLQQRMNLAGTAEIERARQRVPVRYFVFDLLRDGDVDLTALPWHDRRARLERAVTAASDGHGVVQVPPVFEGDLQAALSTSKRLHFEGVMAKDRASTYAAGRRSGRWLKLKHHLAQEVVVIGWRPGQGRREGGVGSLLLGIPDADRIRYVGKVGTGFRDRDLDAIAERLAPLTSGERPADDVPALDARGAHWVRPDLVAEVEFAEWTHTGRLRQPSWRGWRDDKAPADVVRES